MAGGERWWDTREEESGLQGQTAWLCTWGQQLPGHGLEDFIWPLASQLLPSVK